MISSNKAIPQGTTLICSNIPECDVIVGLTGWLAVIGVPYRGALGEDKMDSHLVAVGCLKPFIPQPFIWVSLPKALFIFAKRGMK